MRLLLAEKDPALATFLRDGLEYEHYAVDLAETVMQRSTRSNSAITTWQS